MEKYKKILAIALCVAGFLSLAAAGVLLWKGAEDNRRNDSLLETLRPSDEDAENPVVSPVPSPSPDGPRTEEVPVAEPDPTPEPTPTPIPRIENPYRESFLANSDMAGWLQIPGTEIDYPIMWTPEDENFYLYRDFEGKDNKNGSLILDTESSLDPLTTNLIIHGHNMRSGAMFGNLTDYEDPDYFKEHREIILYTEECQRKYEIIAVFRSQVYLKSDDVFKFYKFFQANTPEEFDDFYNNIKSLSQYDTGVTAEFGDRFITLSTCVYHVEQGRFVVVARETDPGDFYLPVWEEDNLSNQGGTLQ